MAKFLCLALLVLAADALLLDKKQKKEDPELSDEANLQKSCHLLPSRPFGYDNVIVYLFLSEWHLVGLQRKTRFSHEMFSGNLV